MLTTARTFKLCARASLINGRNRTQFAWNYFQNYGIFDLTTNGVKCLILIVTILWLCLKRRNDHPYQETSLNGIIINSELVSLPENLCCIWASTRDFKQRKLNYPHNHRYGLELQTNRKLLHVILCILLAGDVATNPGPCSSLPNSVNNRSVKCLALNARSLTSFHGANNSEGDCSNILERFQNLVYTEDSDIVCVNETWLREDTGPDNLEILHSGYTIFRKDRKSRGGGVLLAVKSSSFKSVREIKHNYNIEVTVAELTTASDMKLLVASCYRPPNEDQTWMERFNNFLGGVCSNHANIVLAGDFNLPQISWNSPETTTGVSESTFIELLHDYFLVQLNNTATRGDNILDLVITNIPDLG
jgi:hypothetical protein